MIQDLIPDTLPNYGDRFKIGGYNRLGRECYAMISTRGYTGGVVTELLGAGESPIEISASYADNDFFRPIGGMSCTISIQETEWDNFMALARGDDTSFAVRVAEKDGEENEHILFRGYLRPETFIKEYGTHKPVVTIDATDGFGILRNMKFLSSEGVDFMDFVGEHPVKDIIAYILSKAGNREPWRDYVYYCIDGTNRNLIHNMMLPVWDLYGESCYDVLKHVLSVFNMQIQSDRGVYVIRLLDRPKQGTFDQYTYKGNYAYSDSDDESILNLHDYDGVTGRLTNEKPVRNINFTAKNPASENLLYNADLSKGKAGWETWGGYPDSDFTVTRQQIRLSSGNPLSGSHMGIKTNFSRGFGPLFHIMFECEVKVAKAAAEDSFLWRIYFRSGGGLWQVRQWRQEEQDDWEKIKYITSYSAASPDYPDRYFYIRPWAPSLPDECDSNQTYGLGDEVIHNGQGYMSIAPINNSTPPSDFWVAIPTDVQKTVWIRDMKLYTIKSGGNLENYEPTEDFEQERVVEISKNSLQDVEHEVRYAFGGGNYKYQESFPHHPYTVSQNPLYDRENEKGALNRSVQEQRIIDFHQIRRKRLNVEFYKTKDSDEIRSQTLFFDKHLKQLLSIMSWRYDLLKNKYDMEMIEYRQATEEEFMKWIFWDGAWDDDGYWIDDVENTWP